MTDVSPASFIPLSFHWGQRTDTDVPEFDHGTMAQKADVPLVALQTGVGPTIQGPLRRGLLHVAIHNDNTIHGHFDTVTSYLYLLLIPLACWAKGAAFCSNDSVH